MDKNKLKSLFTEDVRKVLSDETLDALEEAINTKIDLTVEAALIQQDDEYAEKLKTLMEMVDNDRTNKLKRAISAVDRNNAAKLIKVVKKYERDQLTEAKNFKKKLVSSINAFLDEEVLTSFISESDLSQAVKNKTAYNVLENLRKVLAVDSTLMKDSVKEAVLDGKKQLDEKTNAFTQLEEKYNKVVRELENTKRKVFLNEKTSRFPEDKQKFIEKTLNDKSLKFIEENFDYVCKLFDKEERKQKKVIKEEALNKREYKPDVIKEQKIVKENINNSQDDNPYLAELDKIRKF